MQCEPIPNYVLSTLLDVHTLLSHLSNEDLLSQSTLHPDFINKVCDAVSRHLKDSRNG